MEQLKNTIENIPTQNRIWAVVIALAVGAGVFYFVHWQKERNYTTLYTALAAEDAAAIVQKLKETGVDYRVGEGGTSVEVSSDKTAEIRLQMAAAGLPKSGRIGFELFDKTSFGTTDFTEHINYQRALEGELERSVMSLNEVEHARVHITFAKDSVFLDSREPAKASVLVQLVPGATLQPGSVIAITHLIASAVEGLAPDSVSVLDMRGNLLNRPRKASVTGASDADMPDAVLDYQQQIERRLVAKINSTLEPMLGTDKFRAAVSVDCDFTSGEQSEEIFDPTKSVIVSSEKSEDASVGSQSGGVPGTASALPRESGTGSDKRASGASRRSESVSYQTSRTVRRTKLPQGAIRRVSASVLVDHTLRWEGSGKDQKRIVEPPTADQLKVIHDVVAGAIALNTDRGDQLIVEAVPFESTLHADPPGANKPAPEPPKTPAQVYVQKIQENPVLGIGVGAGVLVLLVVLIGLMVASRRRSRQAAAVVAQQLPAAAALPNYEPPAMRKKVKITKQKNVEPPPPPPPPVPPSKRIEAATMVLREEAGKGAQALAGTLQQWVEEG